MEADDGEGYKDTTTVNIVMPVRREATPTPISRNIPQSTTSQQQVPESTPTAETIPTTPTVPAFRQSDI